MFQDLTAPDVLDALCCASVSSSCPSLPQLLFVQAQRCTFQTVCLASPRCVLSPWAFVLLFCSYTHLWHFPRQTGMVWFVSFSFNRLLSAEGRDHIFLAFQAQNLELCPAYRRCSIHMSGVEINQIKHQQKKTPSCVKASGL